MHVAGKPILGHILDQVEEQKITDVILILGYLGSKIKEYVEEKYSHLNFTFVQQDKAEGPAHAIHLAKPFVNEDEQSLIIFGDTIFVGDLSLGLSTKADLSIAVKEVQDPRRFGVCVMKEEKVVDVEEKPDYVKPMNAMIGIYFANKSKLLFDALDLMVQEKRMTKGEYYLPDAFKVMLEKGANIDTFNMEGWFDCGKPETLLSTNRYLLDKKQNGEVRVVDENTIIIPPVFIGEEVVLKNSIIGPHVSIADNVEINSSIIKNSIVNKNALIENAQLQESLIGENAVVEDIIEKINVGDNSQIRFSGE